MIACLLLHVAETDLRASISPIVSCTDATPSHGGTVRGLVSPDLAEFVYEFSERKGEHVRLDWDRHHEKIFPTKMMAPQKFTREVLKAVSWQVADSARFETSAHINIQEMRQIKREVASRAAGSLVSMRFGNVIDSRVCLEAWA